MSRVKVLMFSGGLDSTAALYRLLKMDAHMVVAHHINFINSEQRHYVERYACSKIIHYLKTNVRDFEYTESTFAFPYNRHIGWDIIHAMYIGGIVVKNYLNDDTQVELSIADTKDDFGSYQWKSPVAQMIAVLAALEKPMLPRQLLPIITQPVVDKTKAELIEMLPKELFNLTWSCRKPKITVDPTNVTFSYCGKCVTCADLKKINQFESKTITLPRDDEKK